jgi:hypothetical protein
MGRQAEIDRTLSRSIRRELSSPMTARFARSLPFLHASDVLPTRIMDLLEQLEVTERHQAAGRDRGRH